MCKSPLESDDHPDPVKFQLQSADSLLSKAELVRTNYIANITMATLQSNFEESLLSIIGWLGLSTVVSCMSVSWLN